MCRARCAPALPAVQAVAVHPPEVREPVPLSIHHLPLPISFALWEVRGRAPKWATWVFKHLSADAQAAPACARNGVPVACRAAVLRLHTGSCQPAQQLWFWANEQWAGLFTSSDVASPQGGELIAVDPSLKEEAAAAGKLTGAAWPRRAEPRGACGSLQQVYGLQVGACVMHGNEARQQE